MQLKRCILTLVLTFTLSLLVQNVLAGFQDPFLKELDPPIPGVDLNNDAIEIFENIPEVGPLRIMEILVTDPLQPVTIYEINPRNENITVESEGSDGNARFYLTLLHGFDYELVNNYYVTVSHGGGPRMSFFMIVKDVNDNPPVITNDPQRELSDFYDEGDSFPAEFITRLQATDVDSVDQDALRYSFNHLIGEGSTPIFRMDAISGELFIIQALDYAEASMHRLELIVKDSGDINSASFPVTINVRDLPNLPPVFTKIPPTLTVNENTALNTIITKIEARDGDLALGWPIKFELIENHGIPELPDLKFFEMDPDTGDIKIIRLIDAEELNHYGNDKLVFVIEIIATEVPDENEFPGFDPESIRQEITVNIRDLDDNFPQVCIIPPDFTTGDESCGPTQEYSMTINEDHLGIIDLDKGFYIRDMDPTYSFSQYTVDFAANVHQRLKTGFKIQPQQGAGVTEFSVMVNDPNQLDCDDGDNFWYDEDSNPRTQRITFEIKSGNNVRATAIIDVSVIDINDNDPEFGLAEYPVNICENAKKDDLVMQLTPDSQDPDVCDKASPPNGPVVITASDSDVTSQALTFSWYSRQPPIDIIDNGGNSVTLRINNDANFDYERFTEEVYVLQVSDSAGKSAQTTVHFNILDKNDRQIDLEVPARQVTIQENIDDPGRPILSSEIIATDEDLNPNIRVEIKWDEAKAFTNNSDKYERLSVNDEEIESWFELITVDDGTNQRRKEYQIVLTNKKIDREYGAGVDRVDIPISARDLNDPIEFVDNIQILTVLIEDVNDEPPYWEEDNQDRASILETRAGEEDRLQEILTVRVRDPDISSKAFTFEIEARDCGEHCDHFLQLVELRNTNPALGKAILYRQQGREIDREDVFDRIGTDFLKYTITAYDDDQLHASDPLEIEIEIEDRNDEEPIFEPHDPSVSISETIDSDSEIIRFLATDRDKPDPYGNISVRYFIDSVDGDGRDKFLIDDESGGLKAIGPFDWYNVKSYNFRIVAKDNYGQSGANTAETIIAIVINDENTHPPEFITDQGPIFSTVNETFLQANVELAETITILDRDNPSLPNGQYSVSIVGVTWEKNGVVEPVDPLPFRPGALRPSPIPGSAEKQIPIISTRNFTHQWGTYVLTFEAKDNGDEPTVGEYTIKVSNENLNTPEFTFPNPTNETNVIVPLDHNEGPLYDWHNERLVAHANDLDDPEEDNGIVEYFSVEMPEDPDDGSAFLDVFPNGDLRLKQKFTDLNRNYYHFYIRAQDKGSPSRSSVVRMNIYTILGTNRPPIFNNTEPVDIVLMENEAGVSAPITQAFDPDDIDLPEDLPPELIVDIYYHIVGGTKDVFTIKWDMDEEKTPFVVSENELDREEIKEYQIVVYVSNDPTPPSFTIPPDAVPDDPLYLLVNIEVGNEWDTTPVFDIPEGIFSAGFSVDNKIDDRIATLAIIEEGDDDDDEITWTITDAIPSDPSLDPALPFKIVATSETSANLLINFAPQPHYKGYYSFTVTATDLGDNVASIEAKIYMIKENNVVEFTFLNRREDIENKSIPLARVLSDSFEYRCNIDTIQSDVDTVNATKCYTHFIDLSTNEPVLRNYIEEQQFIPEVSSRLTVGLSEIGITLARDGIGRPPTEESDGDKLVIYILIGAVAFVGVVFIVMSTSCYFNNRSLSRRVRALTATTFGSQMSGLNRTGAALDLPNTNEFAIEGSNPMWTSPAGADPSGEKKVPAFDAESVGSGGSVLIGVEDDEDFKNYKENRPTSSASPFYQSDGEGEVDDEDLYDNPNSQQQNRNALYESDSAPGSEDERRMSQVQVPPGFGNTSMRHNPLANMAFDDDE